MKPNWIVVGAIAGLLGVGLGAFGAHGLEARATPEQLAWWETGARYQLVHALALAIYGLVSHRAEAKSNLAGWSFAIGIVLFSGTLYAMALGAPRWFGAITPIGGIALMVGWLALAMQARKLR
jgi:uncharacterized membrane protein YgdD (TMEM256/DUF423 family)